tara:strand:+ start:52 stop:441 length:390 start_codon:yes stop_codon:yes gene_type:complete
VRPLEQSPSQWNKFRNTYYDYKLFFNLKVLIRTNRLGVFRIGNERLKRLELNYNLHKNGLSNKDICEYLSLRKLKTFRTQKEYTPKLIWGTIQKYKKRLQRNKDKILFLRESLYVEKFRKETENNEGSF